MKPVRIMLLKTRMVLYYLASVVLLFGVIPQAVRQLDAFLPRWELPPGGRWIGGIVFLVAGAGYSYCAVWLMRRGEGPYVEFDPPRQLVQTGPYRWCRNPVAASVLAAILGEALFFSSPALAGLFLLGLPVAHAQAVLLEEPLLRKRFGPAYEHYCERVPRWFPQRPSRQVTLPSS